MAKTKGNKKQDRIFTESSSVLFRLLAHHPHFIKEITKARKKYGIEITDKFQNILVWKNDHRPKYHKLVSDLMSLAQDFDIPQQLQSATKLFILDYVFLNRWDIPTPFEAGLKVHKWSENQQIMTLNPVSIYLEITPTTSEREIRDNWEKIVGKRKETRKLGIQKPNVIDERVWELTKMQTPKLDTKIVTARLKDEFPNNSFLPFEINKHRFDYGQVLSKLRPIKL